MADPAEDTASDQGPDAVRAAVPGSDLLLDTDQESQGRVQGPGRCSARESDHSAASWLNQLDPPLLSHRRSADP